MSWTKVTKEVTDSTKVDKTDWGWHRGWFTSWFSEAWTKVTKTVTSSTKVNR